MIHVVTVCVNCADYLAFSLPENRKVFDSIRVVTTPKDTKTIGVCQRNGVEVVLSERCYEGGTPFDRGKMLNDGFKVCYGDSFRDDWFLHLDADIIANPAMGRLNTSELNQMFLYGCDRYFVSTLGILLDIWTEQNGVDWNMVGDFSWLYEKAWERGSYGIGFFQLFSDRRWYPEGYRGTEGSDVAFRDSFSGRRKLKMPCLHLGPYLGSLDLYGRRSPEIFKWEW